MVGWFVGTMKPDPNVDLPDRVAPVNCYPSELRWLAWLPWRIRLVSTFGCMAERRRFVKDGVTRGTYKTKRYPQDLMLHIRYDDGSTDNIPLRYVVAYRDGQKPNYEACWS